MAARCPAGTGISPVSSEQGAGSVPHPPPEPIPFGAQDKSQQGHVTRPKRRAAKLVSWVPCVPCSQLSPPQGWTGGSLSCSH